MKKTFVVDYVSDIACAWCVIGLYSLERALAAFPDVEPEFRFHPFELCPSLGPEGENLLAHLEEKYEVSAEEVEESFRNLAARGAELGFTYNFHAESRIWNTFDAHRLVHWAAGQGRALALEKALYVDYFTANNNVSDFGVLAAAAERAGLDRNAALSVLESGQYRDETRQELALWRERGVNVVPTIRLADKMTISCAQTVKEFERSIRAVLEGAPVAGMALM